MAVLKDDNTMREQWESHQGQSLDGLSSPTRWRRDSPRCELLWLRECHEGKFAESRTLERLCPPQPSPSAGRQTHCVTVNKQKPSASPRSTSLFKSRGAQCQRSPLNSLWIRRLCQIHRPHFLPHTDVRGLSNYLLAQCHQYTGFSAFLFSLFWGRGSNSALFTSSSFGSVKTAVWLSVGWNIRQQTLKWAWCVFCSQALICVCVCVLN